MFTRRERIKMDIADISYAQGVVNWAVLSKVGLRAVYPRIGYGEINNASGGVIDSQFHANVQNGLAFGVILGGYLFSYSQNNQEAELEAKFSISELARYGPSAFRHPIWLDCESEKYQGNIDINPLIDIYCSRMIEAGYKSGFYCSLDWYKRKVSNEIKQKYEHWSAQYNDTHEAPCSVWQYTSKGSLPGIGGNVDLNWLYKNYEINEGGTIYVPIDIPPVLEPIYSDPVYSVLELQRVLRMLNFGPDLELDGIMGQETASAVMVAQRGYGIDVDGVPGKITEHYLKSQLRTVQNRLNEVGGYGIEVDGRLGDAGTETIYALQNFQYTHNLEADWIIVAKTYQKLFNDVPDVIILPPVVSPVEEPISEPIFGQLTEHFNKSEFACDCGGAYCNGFPVEINLTLVQRMEQVRVMLNAPIYITSGVRCEIRNAEVGGIPYSKHKQGLACDFYTPGMTSDMVTHLANLVRSVGLVAYEYHDQLFVHAEI